MTTTNTTASIDLAQLDFMDSAVRKGEYLSRTDLSMLIALARRSLTSEAPAEPIYQVQYDSEKGTSAWHDASEAAYHTFMPERRRIVYVHDAAAPSAGQAPIGYITTGDIKYGSEGAEVGDWDIEWDRKVIDAMPEFAVPETTYAVYLERVPTKSAGAAAKTEQADAVAAIVRDVCELDYSGENWDHEKMLSVTVDDLRLICERNIAKSSTAAGAGSAQPAALDERALPPLPKHHGYTGPHKVYYESDMINFARAALTQQAGAAAPSREDVAKIKTWQERLPLHDYVHSRALRAEIADLRAALARAPLPAHSGQDGEKDAPLYSTRAKARRYEWLRDWFLRGGLRSEVAPNGRIQKTTPAMVDAAIDAAMRANDGAAEQEGGAK